MVVVFCMCTGSTGLARSLFSCAQFGSHMLVWCFGAVVFGHGGRKVRGKMF